MSGFLGQILGGGKQPSGRGSNAEDPDFAEFAGAPEPVPYPNTFAQPSEDAAASIAQNARPQRPYTAWYRVWERTSPADFYQEMILLPVLTVILLIFFWGKRVNKARAKTWVSAYVPILKQEFALVGFGGRRSPTIDEVQSSGLAQASASDDLDITKEIFKEHAANEYITYATGRQNVAFADVKLVLHKRYNPFVMFGEKVFALFFESLPATTEKAEATLYCFDGKEEMLTVFGRNKSEATTPKKFGSSTFDGFVWAIIHKDSMKRLRDSRYDLSLTATKDHAKLPHFVTVMSESAEITETLLNNELAKAIQEAGDIFEALIVTDMPIDQPRSVEDLTPKKRVTLSLRLPGNPSEYGQAASIFKYFLRVPDQLASAAHFRSEALRRVKQTRDEEARKIRKLDEQDQAEERKAQYDKDKKRERDAKLSNMSADEQRKFLEKERERDLRKDQKKRSVKG